MGIEPTLSAWEAEVLPLNYTRLKDDYKAVCRSRLKSLAFIAKVGWARFCAHAYNVKIPDAA